MKQSFERFKIMSRGRKTIVIKQLGAKRPKLKEIYFEGINYASRQLGRSSGYISSKLQSGRHILEDDEGTFYVVVMCKGEKINYEPELKQFYKNKELYIKSHFYAATNKTPHRLSKSRKQVRAKKKKSITEKLLEIDLKYGSLKNAEGTKEFKELQKLENRF